MVKTAEKKKKKKEENNAEDINAALGLIKLSRVLTARDLHAAEKEYHSASLKKHTVLEDEEEESKKMRSKRRNLDAYHEFAESCKKMPKAGFVHGKNRSGSLKIILEEEEEDEDEEFKRMRSKRRNLDVESKIPRGRIAGRSNHSGSLKKHNVLDDEEDEEEEIMRSRSKRRYLGGENEAKSTTPQARIAGGSNSVSEKLPKPRIGYSIDGKKLPKPKFGYSIDGKKLPRTPPIQNLKALVGECSKPYEKKLLKTDLEIDQDKLSFHRYGVQREILPVLNEVENRRLADKKGVGVNTYDEFGNCYKMIFESYQNSFYKLCNGWKNLLKDHELKENEDCYVAVWVFRHVETGALCFALMLKR